MKIKLTRKENISLSLSLFAIVNLVLIILDVNDMLDHRYLDVGFAYAIFHLIYQFRNKEGLFFFRK